MVFNKICLLSIPIYSIVHLRNFEISPEAKPSLEKNWKQYICRRALAWLHSFITVSYY